MSNVDYIKNILDAPQEPEPAEPLPKIWKATDLAKSKPVQWLAEGRIPRGMVTVMVGDEGIGKSLGWVFMVVALTTGKGAPEYGIKPGKPQYVLLFLAENGWADMDRPRLEAAGADLDYIRVIASHEDGTGAGSFSPHIQHEIDALDVKPALIVADPWLDTVPGNFNVKDGQQAKQAIRPWRETAVRHNAGVLLIAHTNRMSSASAREKYGATAELRKTARMTLYAQVDDETGYLAIGPEKSNLVPPGAKADNFRIRSEFLPGFDSGVPVLEYVGQSDHTATDLIEEKFAVAQAAGNPDTIDAKEIILEYLKFHDGHAPADDVKSHWESKNLAKPSWKTITNSRRKWGIETEKTADGWVWSLPDVGKQDPEHPEPPYISGGRDLGIFNGQGVNPRSREQARSQDPKIPSDRDAHPEPPHISGNRDLGSEQVTPPKSDPEQGQIPHPEHTDTRASGAAGLHQLAELATTETGPAVDAVLNAMSTEHALSPKVIEQSVPLEFRGQVEKILDRLMFAGTITPDDRGRYIKKGIAA